MPAARRTPARAPPPTQVPEVPPTQAPTPTTQAPTPTTQALVPTQTPTPTTQAPTPTTQAPAPTQADDGLEQVGSSSQRTAGSRINSRARGVARGTRVEPGDGSRLRVDIPDEWNAPVGRHATKFAGEIGCRVRQDLTRFDYPRWSSIPESDRAPIVTSVKSKFTCLGSPITVDKVINTKAARSARQHKHRWHVKWEKDVQERREEYARENRPQGCTPDQWTSLIDNMWTTEEFKAKSTKNKINRSKQTKNHSCGSKSLPSLAHDEMEKNEGRLDFPEFFRHTHYNAKKKKWSSPDDETTYNNMVNDVESQGSVSLTPEQMSRKHLGIRSGVLKGLGMRPSSSAPSIASSTEQRREIEEQRRELEEQRRELEEQRREMQEQRRQMQEMFAWMATQGYQGPPPRPPPPPPDDGSAGCGIAA